MLLSHHLIFVVLTTHIIIVNSIIDTIARQFDVKIFTALCTPEEFGKKEASMIYCCDALQRSPIGLRKSRKKRKRK